MNIYQRINAVRKEIGYVQKDKSVSTGQGSYKAVTHDQVTGMVRKHLIDHGVIIVPSLLDCVFHPKEVLEDGKIAKQRLYEATFQVDFVNMDNPEEKISTKINAHALDNGDKAPGKAMSYATKYAILKLFSIETGEDEESRYQVEDFDLAYHRDLILECETLETLKKQFAASLRAAEEARDRQACKDIIAAKDTRKKQLEGASK